MASHRYWRLHVIENYGNFYAGKGAVATIDLRVSSGGSNLATTGNGTASASTETAGFEASKAFDGDVNTYWLSGDAATANSQWIKWDFGAGNEKDINYVALTNGNEAAGSALIKRWMLAYSDDNTNWTPWMYSTSNNSSASNDTPTAWSWAADMVSEGTATVTMGVMTLTSRTGGSATVTGPVLTIEAYGSRSLDATLPALTLESRSGSIVSIDLPTLSLLATGHSRASELDITLPSMTLEAYSGGALIQALAALTFEGDAEIPVIGSTERTLRTITLEASGTVAMVANLSANLAALVGAAAGGADGAGTLPALSIDAEGTVGSVGTLSRVIPVLTLEASGDIENFGGLDATLPSLQRANAGHASMSLPRFTLRATGYLVVDTEYEAWAMNMLPGEGMPHQVTEYTNFPFNQIIRYGEDYYGVADDGLYLLGGETDYDPTTPAAIAWTWRTAITDFGSRQMKVVRESVHYGRLGATATATVAVAEGTQRSYAALIERGEAAQAHRIKYGKGLKGVYWQFGMSDTSGSAMELDASTYDALPTSRKI